MEKGENRLICGDESSSSSDDSGDGDSDEPVLPSTSTAPAATAARPTATKKRKQRVEWKTVRQNSADCIGDYPSNTSETFLIQSF
ncbi:Hypothetical predicted protein [Scomber scombrus]|uniref:Uncharacterized protein n=1 Tax=Scomber scombrus TaxID=13677 RepID=A0AAV1Q8W3_SCOSC